MIPEKNTAYMPLEDLYDLTVFQSPAGASSRDSFTTNYLIRHTGALKDPELKTFVNELVDAQALIQRPDILIARAVVSPALAAKEKKGRDGKFKRFRFNGKKGLRVGSGGAPCLRRIVARFEGEIEGYTANQFIRGVYYNDEITTGPDGTAVTTVEFVPTILNAFATKLAELAAKEEGPILVARAVKNQEDGLNYRYFDDYAYIGASEYDLHSDKRSTDEKVDDATDALAVEVAQQIEDAIDDLGLDGILTPSGQFFKTDFGKLVAISGAAVAIAAVCNLLPAPVALVVRPILTAISSS